MKPQGTADVGWRELNNLMSALSLFLSAAHKRQLFIVSLWAFGLSVLEMLVAAAVVPYVNCLTGRCPVSVEHALRSSGCPIVPVLSLGLFLLITLKLFVHACLSWSTANFNQQVQSDTIGRLLDGYLHLDWMSFRAQHRVHYFRRCATTAVDAAYVSYQCVTIISSVLILTLMLGLMLWEYPMVSITLIAGFLAVNVFSQRLIGHAQQRAAHEREAALQRWNIGMAESFASFREIRLYVLEQCFLANLNRSINSLAQANKRLGFFPILPRLILDFAVFGTLLLVVTVWLFLQLPVAELLPHLIFYAVVARAMLPAMLNLLSTRAVLFGSLINIQLILNELSQTAASRVQRVGITPTLSKKAFFALEHVTFGHVSNSPAVIINANIRILHPSWVAIVGTSGVGKSTLLELLCGIYAPDAGRVLHAWPSNGNMRHSPRISYLPQHVALLDGTIVENVVFGFDEGDTDRVNEALSLACMDGVIEGLPEHCETQIGPDGARLSGGERQRLALARALYRRPDLLLLDEATSGLDEIAEVRLLSTLRQRRPCLTVVYTSHRSSNLRFADRVLRLQDGRLEDVTPTP